MAGFHRVITLILFVSCTQIALASRAATQVPEGNAAFQRGDYEQALTIFRDQAGEGQAGAQFNLGVMYLEGRGVAQDFAEAARWFRRAAEQGLSQAQFELGLMHVQGRGVERNYDEAVDWWRKAAAQGNVQAQHGLGVQYAIGRGPGWGLDRDEAEAVRWWQMAARAGHAPAQYELGLSYIEGRGVERDRLNGLMWLLLAEAGEDVSTLDPRKIERQKRRVTAQQLARAEQRAQDCQRSQFRDCR